MNYFIYFINIIVLEIGYLDRILNKKRANNSPDGNSFNTV